MPVISMGLCGNGLTPEVASPVSISVFPPVIPPVMGACMCVCLSVCVVVSFSLVTVLK